MFNSKFSFFGGPLSFCNLFPFLSELFNHIIFIITFILLLFHVVFLYKAPLKNTQVTCAKRG